MKLDKFSAGMLLGAAMILAGMISTWAGYDAILSIAIFIMAGSAIVTLAALYRRGDLDWCSGRA